MRCAATPRGALALALLATVAPVAGSWAQPAAVEQLRALVVRDEDAALRAAVRTHPDDARELVRRLLVEAGTSRGRPADSTLAAARRLAGAYAAAWDDSFPLAQVERFERSSADRRAAKLAADSVRREGNAALGRSGVAAALALWRTALARSAEIADTAGMAAALGNIGVGLYRVPALDSAEHYLARARQLAAVVGDHRTALNALGAQASVAKDRGDLRRAQALYREALALRARIGDLRGTASDHNNLGLVAQELGELAEARTHYETALALARRHRLPEPESAALVNLGNVASVQGDYAAAARRYGEALASYRSSGSEADAALVLHDLGLLALRRGDYRTAQVRLEEARAVHARTGTGADLVRVRRDLALVLASAGDLRGALGELRRAERPLARLPGADDLAGGVALARADVALQLDDHLEAERAYARAEAFYRRAGNSAGVAEAREGRAWLLIERGRPAPALELLRATARAQTMAGDRRAAALTRVAIGYAQQRQRDAAGARRTLEQARDSLAALSDAVGEAAALSALGDLELDAGAPLSAEAMYRRGLGRLAARPAASVSWPLRAGLGRALHARGALGESAAQLRAAIAEVERVAGTLPAEDRRAVYLADKWDVYAELAMVERARGDVAAAFEANDRARARQMLDLLARGRVAPPTTTDSALVDREQDLRRAIAELTRRLETADGGTVPWRGPALDREPGDAPGATREALARAQEEYARLLLELREAGSAHLATVRGTVAPWREVAGRLSSGEALLEYLVLDSTAIAFVVTSDSLRIVDLGVGRHTLRSLVDFARGTIVRPLPAKSPGAAGAAAWRAPLRRLHDHLIAPIEESGALAGVHRLVVVPHVELHYLPFSALIRRGTRDEFLIERYEIAYAPSASSWLRLGERPTPPGRGVLALAPRPARLPGSRDEVAAIGSLYGAQATVLTGTAASERAFRDAAPRHRVVHLATYGVLNKHNPLFSFVALAPGDDADGRLEVHEVFGLALQARLLVLSACQTALASGAVSDVPPGDDWVGLVRAFLGAGAANVIATLWPVEDRSTALFMTRLHRGLRAGRSESAALAVAQRETLRDAATADPFYWAGFVLVGGR